MSLWDTSCIDWEDRILSGRSLVPDMPLFADVADKAERIFRRLKIPDVIGTPTMDKAAGPWLFPIVRAIFGSYDPELQQRMINEFFLVVPKKNAKTSTSASIILTASIVNLRPDADIVVVSETKSIADTTFKQIKSTINLDPNLKKIFHVQDHIRLITHRLTDTRTQVKAADTDVITGGKQVITLVDESHLLGVKNKAAEIYVELRGALTARPDGFFMQITTQSKEPPKGQFKEELHYARDVRDGKVKAPLLPVIYEFPRRMLENGDWKKSAFWHLVNPNLHRSVNLPYLEEQMAKADRQGPHALALFASQHLNVEIGIGMRTDRWPGVEYWLDRADPEIDQDYMIEHSDVIVLGIDGGGLDDLFGFSAIGREKETGNWLVWTKTWCHKGVLERRQSIAADLQDFEKAGDLTIVDDELEDLSEIMDIVSRFKESGLLAEVGVDPAGLGAVAEELGKLDITVDSKDTKLIGVGQGYQLMNAIKTAERKLANRTMRHSADKCMAWCVSNLKIEPTATAIRATKQNAGDAKIDTAMATFNAAALMSRNPQAPGYSIYEERGLRVA